MSTPDELTPHAAEIRLGQYGERGKPYECGNEKALYEIALTLLGEVQRLRKVPATRAEVLRQEARNLRKVEREDTPQGALGTRTGLLRAALILDERADAAEQGEKDTREGESTPQPAGTCGRALSTGQLCPDHPRQPAELPYTEARAAFMQIGHTPSLQGLRTELHIEGRPPLVGRYIGAGMRKAEHQDGLLIIEPALVFEYAQPAEPGLCPPCKRGDCEDCMAVDHPDQPNLYGCLCRRRDVRGACPRPRTNPAEREPMGDDFGIPGSDD